MAADELDDYLRYGNIRNSVNYPNISMPAAGAVRVCVMHENVPAVLTNLAGAFSAKRINIENMLSKSRGEYAYTMIDVNAVVDDDILAALGAIEGVVRVRAIKF